MSFIPLPQDSIVSAVTTIDWVHSRIHSGKAFMLDGEYTLANGGVYYFILVNPAGNYAHLREFGTTVSAAPCSLELYEGPTVTSNGTLKYKNMNRASANTPNMQTYFGGTVSADGTQLQYILAPGAKQSGGEGSDSVPTEWILAPNTTYALKVTNNSGSTITFDIKAFWYEA